MNHKGFYPSLCKLSQFFEDLSMVLGPCNCINNCVIGCLRKGMEFCLWEKSRDLAEKNRKKGSVAVCAKAYSRVHN